MKIRNLEVVKQILSDCMHIISSELLVFQSEKKLGGIFNTGAWIGGQSLSGGVFYVPHANPDEEGFGVEFIIEPQVETDTALLTAWFGWTHGPIIKEFFWDKVVNCTDENQLAQIVKDSFNNLKDEVIAIMKNEMLIDRPPVYRED